MDMQTLRYVLTLAEERHFRRAAERHWIAPQAFGRRVRDLERELGVRLFDRTSRRVDVTPAGERFLVRARDVLSRVDTLGEHTRDAPPCPDGPVRVGVLGFGTADRWPALRRLVQAQLPDTGLVHVELDWDSQYDAVLAGEVDVALVHDIGPVDGLRLDRVLCTGRVAVVPATSPLADADRLDTRDVDGQPCVRPVGRHPGLTRWAGVASQVCRTSPVVRTPAAIPAAVATSGMLGVHGEPARRFFPRPDVRFVPIEGPACEVSVATRETDGSRAAVAFRRATELVPSLSGDRSGDPQTLAGATPDRNRSGT